jgi:hypothetical protein
MARTTRNAGINQVSLSEIKDDPSRYVREVEAREFDYRSKTIHDFCSGSSRRVPVCVQGSESVWKTSKRNSGTGKRFWNPKPGHTQNSSQGLCGFAREAKNLHHAPRY